MHRLAGIALVATLSVSMLTIASGVALALPDRIPLPDGSQPEGLAISNRGRFYTGSLADGAIYTGHVDGGRVRVMARGAAGRSAVGVEARGRFLWVAGGETGMAWVFHRSGRLVRTYDLQGGFVNDVVVTRHAAYLTDSFEPVLYRVPIRDGVPGGAGSPQARPLRGDIDYAEGFNANGIDVIRGTARFVLVQTNTGRLFEVRPSGWTRAIHLGGARLTDGDGILVDGHVAFVVQNTLNRVASVELGHDLRHGTVTDVVTDPDFDVPTSIDVHRGALYVVNARFSTPVTPDTRYWIAPFRMP